MLPVFNASAQNPAENAPIWLSISDQNNPGSDPITQVGTVIGNSLDITITFPGFWAEGESKNGEDYTRIWHDEFGSYREPGKPALPGKAFNVLVPNGVQVEVVNQTIRSKTIALSDYSLPSKIMPAQIQAAKSEPAPPWTAPDPKQYRSRDPFPQAWFELKNTFQMRDYTIQPIWVNPVRYKAADGQIEILEKIDLRLTWQESELGAAMSQLVSDSPSFDQLVSQIVINPPVLPAYDTKEENKEGYLIITPDIFYESVELQQFRLMKEDQGFIVKIEKLSNIGYTTDLIRTYINFAYTTFAPRPAYLLLVGDTNLIPGFNKSNFDGLDAEFDKTTDLYYGTIDQDFIPDIAVGRLPARSINDLQVILNKIISYNTLGFQDWHTQTSFIASCDNYTVPEGSHDYVISYFTAPLSYPTYFPADVTLYGGDRLYCQTYSARELNILDSINNKRGIITYSGHGNVTSWIDLNYYDVSSTDLIALFDNNAYSFVSSFACLTNDFGNSTINTVFGETWMLLENKGAIAFLGSADLTIWGPDDAFERNLFEILFSNPLDPPSLRTAITGALSLINYPTAGIGTEQYYWETYNLLGDPSQKLWLYPDDTYYFITQITEDDKSGLIGSTVEYQINLINYGLPDSYTIQVQNNLWPSTTSEVSEIQTKTSMPITISVQIPLSATTHDSDQVQVTITSQNSSQSTTITLTTTAKATFFTHLPLISN
jgi:hypothetical protein